MRAACSRPSLLLPTEEVAEGKNAILIGMSQWNSNDLVEQMETMGKLEEHQGETPLPGAPGMDMLWGGCVGVRAGTHGSEDSHGSLGASPAWTHVPAGTSWAPVQTPELLPSAPRDAHQ